jgi:hypothetical protein
MKSFISILSIIDLLVIMMIGPSVLASNDTATVSATVTVQSISVSVSPGTVTYGTLAQNSTKSTCDLSDPQTVTNDGNVAEDFNIKGQNSANWTLGTTPGSDVYVHKFSTSTCGSINWATAPTLATSTYATMATNVATSSNVTLNLQINTPNPSTVFTQQSVDVTVQAVAHQ